MLSVAVPDGASDAEVGKGEEGDRGVWACPSHDDAWGGRRHVTTCADSLNGSRIFSPDLASLIRYRSQASSSTRLLGCHLPTTRGGEARAMSRRARSLLASRRHSKKT